jgi:putative MATE family efflux protein
MASCPVGASKSTRAGGVHCRIVCHVGAKREVINTFMKDLTHGSIYSHLVAMAIPIAAGMLLQTLYYVVDLYFVAQLGDAALAGVSAAGTAMFIIFALTQMLGVGTVALMSHAVGANHRSDANHIFNQSVAMSAVCAAITLAGGFGLSAIYMRWVGADAATMAAGVTYLYWFTPGLALQFALVAMGSALRGTGIVRPTMIVQALTVALNIVLAPVLIAGWGTGLPLGVAGAALASTLSIAVGVALMSIYFLRLEHYVGFDRASFRPRLSTWLRILNIGLPAGGEFALMAVFIGVVYWIIRDFGAAAQAGFGIGSRVMQSIFLPAMAVAFAAAPIAGQNFGARDPDRVRETFRAAALASCAIMAALTLLCQWQGQWLIRAFTNDPAVIDVGAEYLRVISWNFVATGLVFTCSSLFQGLGNTWPSLISSASRLLLFAGPAVWLSLRPDFRLVDIWHLSVATVALQAVASLLLLQMQFRARLPSLRAAHAPEA